MLTELEYKEFKANIHNNAELNAAVEAFIASNPVAQDMLLTFPNEDQAKIKSLVFYHLQLSGSYDPANQTPERQQKELNDIVGKIKAVDLTQQCELKLLHPGTELTQAQYPTAQPGEEHKVIFGGYFSYAKKKPHSAGYFTPNLSAAGVSEYGRNYTTKSVERKPVRVFNITAPVIALISVADAAVDSWSAGRGDTIIKNRVEMEYKEVVVTKGGDIQIQIPTFDRPHLALAHTFKIEPKERLSSIFKATQEHLDPETDPVFAHVLNEKRRTGQVDGLTQMTQRLENLIKEYNHVEMSAHKTEAFLKDKSNAIDEDTAKDILIPYQNRLTALEHEIDNAQKMISNMQRKLHRLSNQREMAMAIKELHELERETQFASFQFQREINKHMEEIWERICERYSNDTKPVDLLGQNIDLDEEEKVLAEIYDELNQALDHLQQISALADNEDQDQQANQKEERSSFAITRRY